MLYALVFLLGLACGLFPVLRRWIETLRWAWLCKFAAPRGITVRELSESEILKRIEYHQPQKPQPRRLRRAK